MKKWEVGTSITFDPQSRGIWEGYSLQGMDIPNGQTLDEMRMREGISVFIRTKWRWNGK
jgi:hypothetical protein